MGGSFSSSNRSSAAPKKKPPGGSVSATDRAMLDLKNSRDKLTKYKIKLEQDESKLVARAKAAKAKGDTKNALLLLKIRKIKLREVETVEGQLLNVLQMVQTIDSTQNQAQMLAAMKQGKDTLKRMHEETTVDDILELMDEIHEQHELEREINQVFEGVPELSVEDEAAVEAELEALMDGPQEEDVLPAAPNTTPLPVAPTTKLPEQVPGVTTQQERTAVAS
ncbi:Snf7 family protein [Nitzschia inconspicua]|uniref:Snf7 family protein n=1 Tax=Nitzschia inconspicua TaxID=303405 RepID=A0A9K3LWP3_9STRA|nr:Snf7 family protein [Nitzschia inconspicua]